VVIADDEDLARHIAEAAADPETDDIPIEVRVSSTGPTRATGEVVAQVVFIVGQLGLGAAGNGVWVAIEHLWRCAFRRRTNTPPDGPPVITRITVVVPTSDGEARVESLTIGPDGGAEGDRNLEDIVRALRAGERAGT
jgi:hypothetical protein